MKIVKNKIIGFFVLQIVFGFIGALQAAQITPVLLEVFTADGCRKCNPITRHVSEIEEIQPIIVSHNIEIIPVVYHLTSYDKKGWKDQYAQTLFDHKHKRYAKIRGRTLRLPFAVFQGEELVPATARSYMLAAAVRAAEGVGPRISIKRIPRKKKRPEKYKLTLLARDAKFANSEVEFWMVIVEDEIRTKVRKGLNKGKKLEHTALARDVIWLGRAKGNQAKIKFVSPYPRGKWPENKRAVVYAQYPNTGAILAVTRLPIHKKK